MRINPLLAVLFSVIAGPTWAANVMTFQDCRDCPSMVALPTGSVQAGDPHDYEDPEPDAPPRPKIVIERPYAIGMYEVTQAEWNALMPDNPSDVKGANLPVSKVTWRKVQEYLEKLNVRTGKKYRLPSESEWEYAARAGSSASYSFGEDENLLRQYGWFTDNANGVTQPVGRLKPNAFGLHDMHGNVWEWTNDCYSSNYAKMLTPEFENERQSFCYRVIKGGSVLNFAKYATAYHRASLTPVNFNPNLGFRVALSLD